jgi:iron complex transport system substrate-binding protein
MRVVSVLPSATEIVCALGHGRELVGRSEECDYPPSVRSLPVVMRAKTRDFERSSREIDDRVQKVRGSNESLYDLDIDRLRDLEPDLLLTQDLCGVCSVTDAEVAAACAKADVAPRIVSLTPRRLPDVWRSIDTVGRALNDPERGREFSRCLRLRTASPRVRGTLPTVAVVEWLDPPILAGLWTPDMVRAAGASTLGTRQGHPGVRTTWTEIAAARPDLVVVSPCSFPVERTREELRNTRLAQELSRVRPPRGLYLADEAFFSRPGPRLLRSLLEGSAKSAPMPVEPWTAPLAEASA